MVRAKLVDSQSDSCRLLDALPPLPEIVFNALDFHLKSGLVPFAGFLPILPTPEVDLPPPFRGEGEQFLHGALGLSDFVNGTFPPALFASSHVLRRRAVFGQAKGNI